MTSLVIAETTGPLALEEIFVEHGAFVLRAVRRMGVAPSDVEDVTQNVFVTVHRILHQFQGGSLRAWLFAIARRVVADHKKRAYRRREIASSELLDRGVPAEQEGAVVDRELRSLLERALASLDDDKRDVFTLYELEEMPMAEIARAVGCPLKTAYARLYAARRLVRERVLDAMEGRKR